MSEERKGMQMEYSNEPIDPLPAVLPDVDLPCTCGHDGRCDNSGKRCANYRLATLYFEKSGTPFYKPTDRNASAGFVYRVPWSLVRAALAQPAEVKVGDWVEWDEELNTVSHSPSYKPGTPSIRRGTLRALADREGDCLVAAEYGGAWLVPAKILKLAPARSGSVRTCPGEAGYACDCEKCTPKSPRAAQGCGECGGAPGARCDPACPMSIESVRGPSPEPERLCVACNAKLCGAGERCVYCEKRRDDHLSGRESNVKPSDLDERIAAARASIEAAKQRNSVEHPDAFPEDAFLDAPSCDP